MQSQPYCYHRPICYTFSHEETHLGDISRFEFLTSFHSYQDADAARRLLCGAFTLEMEVYPTRAFPVPVHDPLFREFSTKLLKAIPHLAFYINLETEGPWFRHIVWATLSNLVVVDLEDGDDVYANISPNLKELKLRAREVANAARNDWRVVGFEGAAIEARAEAVAKYLVATD